MFKKPVRIGKSYDMKSKDRRNFKKDLKKNFDKQTVDEMFLFVDIFTVQKAEKS